MASSKAHGAASLQSCFMGIRATLAAPLGFPGRSNFHQSTREFIHRVSPEESALVKTSTLLSCLPIPWKRTCECTCECGVCQFA